MFWTSFLVRLEQVGSWLLVGVLIAALVAVVALAVWKIHHRVLAIILTALGSLLCTIPLVSTVNLLVESKAKSLAISETKAELKSLKLQVENESLKRDNLELENKNLSQAITIGNLTNEITLLENAQLSMSSLNEICEVALLETELKQTDVHKVQIGKIEEGWGILADKIGSEVLVITAHDINAKYGVELKEVTIREDEKGVLHVSGVKPKYIGSDRNISNTIVSEIRQIEYKKSKDGQMEQSKITVLKDSANMNRAASYAQQYETQFQQKLAMGQESNFLDSAVVKLAQNFIKLTLASLKQDIVFDAQDETGVPILEYLNGKIKDKRSEIDGLRQAMDGTQA